ncbi:AAEL011487-PA [Aedes aegypti]|uniref:AAEL011487-PA n=1 Tax=Aedes aegypti TaxID=7159 RepID=Q16PX5_AEDAE|nr:AAEL011487-PA [Aedes aegypti]
MLVHLLPTLIVTLLGIGTVVAQPRPDDPSCMEGNQRKAHDCCRMPMLVEQSVMNRCMTENPMTPPVPGVQRTEGCCIAHCVLTTLNAFRDNLIDAAAAKRALTQSMGANSSFVSLVSGVVDECVNLVHGNAAYKVAPVASTPGRPGCSFMPEGFVNCIKGRFFQQCPTAEWTRDAACDQLKQKLTAGCSFGSLMG